MNLCLDKDTRTRRGVLGHGPTILRNHKKKYGGRFTLLMLPASKVVLVCYFPPKLLLLQTVKVPD